MPASRASSEVDSAGGAGRGHDPRPVLALLYAATFAHLGIVLPFLAPWLAARGLDRATIGGLLALPAIFTVAAPWTWGRWADRSGRRRNLLALSAFLAGAALAGLPWAPPLGALALALGLYAFGRSAILPYVEASALEQSELRAFAYGPVRLWGSLAFVVASSGWGAIATGLSPDAALVVAGALLGLFGVAALALPPAEPGGETGPPARTAARPAGKGLARFFSGSALMQASHAAYYAFFSIHLAERGYGAAAIGALWAFAVLCEVLLLTRLDRIVERFGSPAVLRASVAAAVLRWAIVAATASPPALVLAQSLHAATYAAFHVAALRYVHRRFGPGQRARGQALYSGMTFGIGMFGGTLAAGALAEALGLPALFAASSAIALAALATLSRRFEYPDGP